MLVEISPMMIGNWLACVLGIMWGRGCWPHPGAHAEPLHGVHGGVAVWCFHGTQEGSGLRRAFIGCCLCFVLYVPFSWLSEAEGAASSAYVVRGWSRRSTYAYMPAHTCLLSDPIPVSWLKSS